MSAVYAWKCKTLTVLHFSKLIFNGVCELYTLNASGIAPHMLPLRYTTPDIVDTYSEVERRHRRFYYTIREDERERDEVQI